MTRLILRASNAGLWSNCSGSAQAQAGIPDVESDAARAGIATHWLAAEVLNNSTDCEHYIGQHAPNGVHIDAQMANAAQVFVDDVRTAAAHAPDGTLLVEHKTNASEISLLLHNCRLDAALLIPTQNSVVTWDFKSGYRPRSAIQNEQLAVYIKGLHAEYGLRPDTTVIARIVQPNCWPQVSEWRVQIGSDELRGLWQRLNNQALAAQHAPELAPGVWCRDCRAAGVCPAARDLSYSLLNLAEQPYQLDNMPSAALARERQALTDGIAVAKKRLGAIEDQLVAMIEAGDTASGLTVQHVPGRQEWAISPKEVVALMRQFGVDAGKDAVLTPNQAVSAVRKELRPDVKQLLTEFTERKNSKKLVPASESISARAFTQK